MKSVIPFAAVLMAGIATKVCLAAPSVNFETCESLRTATSQNFGGTTDFFINRFQRPADQWSETQWQEAEDLLRVCERFYLRSTPNSPREIDDLRVGRAREMREQGERELALRRSEVSRENLSMQLQQGVPLTQAQRSQKGSVEEEFLKEQIKDEVARRAKFAQVEKERQERNERQARDIAAEKAANEVRDSERQKYAARMNADFDVFKKNFRPQFLDQCYKAIKAILDDPSSFKADPYYEIIPPAGTIAALTLTAMAAPLREQLIELHPIIVLARFRAKNTNGAYQLAQGSCVYYVDKGQVNFYGVL